MAKREKRIIRCPVCKRQFTQMKKCQVYCCRGCMETATMIKKMRRWVDHYSDEILKIPEQTQESA